MANASYFVTYTGTGVVELKGAGVFAHGTGAFVSEEVARAALASGDSWAVTEPSGKQVGSLPAAAPPKPPEAKQQEAKKQESKAEEKKTEKAEEKKADKPEEKKAEEKKAEKAEEKKPHERKEAASAPAQ